MTTNMVVRPSAATLSTIHALVTAQALAHPDAIAVVCDNGSISYAELDRRSDCIAARLCRVGATHGTLVAIGMERSIDMIVGLLGILKSGAAYLPIDPAYPKDRLEFMLQDAQPKALLTSSASRSGLPSSEDATILLIDEEDDDVDASVVATLQALAPSDGDALAYVIYTSGSTGRPKGCQVTHRNVVRLFSSTEHWFDFGPTDVWTFFHSHAFDFSVWEIWGALAYGGRVVVVPYLASRSPKDFHALLIRERVTAMGRMEKLCQRRSRDSADSSAKTRGDGDDAFTRHDT